MSESTSERWPLSPLGTAGLAVSGIGLLSIVAGAFNFFDHGWAYGLGNLFLFGGICFYFFVSWVAD
jgi:hypothetical protein